MSGDGPWADGPQRTYLLLCPFSKLGARECPEARRHGPHAYDPAVQFPSRWRLFPVPQAPLVPVGVFSPRFPLLAGTLFPLPFSWLRFLHSLLALTHTAWGPTLKALAKHRPPPDPVPQFPLSLYPHVSFMTHIPFVIYLLVCFLL